MGLLDVFKKSKPDIEQPCKKCGGSFKMSVLEKNSMICPSCGEYMRMGARQRIAIIVDNGSFKEIDANLSSRNIIDFPDYDNKLSTAKAASGENEAVICGTAKIGGNKCAMFVMDSNFMMGSMGTVVGEKITRLFEKAMKENLPVVGFTTSGGARMQEGIYSLMQMAKVSGAVKRHADRGGLYVAVLTDPTTGGVTASFAMEADILIGEPNALIGFAGARVISQTTGQELPKGFQRAEFLLEHGFLDMIVERNNLKQQLAEILKLHTR